MPFATSHGRAIYYERHGNGPAVLFLHGAGSNAATWWQQLPAFTAAHTCITMDIRCFGRSVAPLQEFALPLFVDDVLAILDREHIARAALVGQSLGGMIALQLALRHPSAHAIAPADWGAALARLLEPAQLTPMHALRRLDGPTLLLVGSEDPIVPVSAMRDVAALVRGCEIAVVPQAGHSTYFEKPGEFNRLVLDFLARRAAWQGAQAGAASAA
jgi:3-oxoadipate enol-lactonase